MAKVKALASASAFLQKAASTPQENHTFKESFETIRPAAMSGFRGMFGDVKLSSEEELRLRSILDEHAQPDLMAGGKIAEDYQTLTRITSEIKAINNQSILLHGERIKKAQGLLKGYKDGAFTAWLLSTYGNRQTPYSMLQYYDFYQILPVPMRLRIEMMPKKAAYVLAAREGALDQKLELIQNYKGEKQNATIELIKAQFPCAEVDKRGKSVNESMLRDIDHLLTKLESRKQLLTMADRRKISALKDRFGLILK